MRAYSLEALSDPGIYSQATDYNPIDSHPIIKNQDSYMLLQFASLAAAIYESPFYWFVQDDKYYKQFIRNRGAFTEAFAAQRLERVFGKSRVFKNVLIQEKKNSTVGEIDTLVVYGDRLIVLQAKSKQLTLKAKQGDSVALDRDFTHAVQNSYDQAFSCADALLNKDYKLITTTGQVIELGREIKEIYPVCVISDHYPSLNAQADRYLETQKGEKIQPPYIMDIFFLDVITEFLDSPLHFINYINLRINNRGLVVSEEELAVFSMHLTAGLRHSRGDNDPLIYLGGHTAIPIDIAFMVRREGLPGKETPKGILTEYKGTYFEKIIDEINGLSDPAAINLGMFLFQISPEEKDSFSQCFAEMLKRGKRDGKPHDFSMMSDGSIGITLHFNECEFDDASDMLYQHCEKRKYRQQADIWIGLCISPSNETIRLGINLEYPWEKCSKLEKKTKCMLSPKRPHDFRTVVRSMQKIGRNEKCYCGSGKKYKQCCY